MEFVTTPEIFHLAHTEVNPDCTKYLDFLGAKDWNTDAQNGAELLIEIAGRRCYKSFGTDLNPNLTRVREGNRDYINNILNSKHGSVIEHCYDTFAIENVSRVFCYTQDTEVLTRTGWKDIADLTEKDLLLTLNPHTNKAGWGVNHKLHSFDYSGKMYAWENSVMKTPVVTPNHIMWAKKYDVRNEAKFEKVEAQDVARLNRFYGEYKIEMGDYSYIENKIEIDGMEFDSILFFTWLGLVCSDGHVSKDRNAVNITQKVEVDYVRELCTELFGGLLKEYQLQDSGTSLFRVSHAGIKKWVIDFFEGRLKTERKIIKLLDYSPDIIEAFIEGIFIGDGSNHEKAAGVIYAPNYRTATEYQALLAAIGISSNVRLDDSRVGTSHDVNGVPITNHEPAIIVSLHSRDKFLFKKEHLKEYHYTGKVYCPKTDDGIIYVRREGRAFWCGNTHELVRHRLCNFSQESMRFVRPTKLSTIFPQVYADHLEADARDKVLALFEETFEYIEDVQQQLVEICGIDELDNFKIKKLFQSANRRLIPDGVLTGIIVTANHRNWRHMLEMRTSMHAEEEIRYVFHQIGKILTARYPAIYQDLYDTISTAGGDIYGEYIPAYEFKNSKI